MAEDDGVRLLSFDGGDIRAISQLHILREFMNRVGYMRQLETPPLPCQYFHLIGGAGTGGLIALLLGVFGMSIEEAEEKFIQIWRIATYHPASKSAHTSSSRDYISRNSSGLRSIIRVFLGKSGRKKDLKLLGSTGDSLAKCFVCASPTADIGECQSFRTFESRLDAPPQITVVEAIRACCALPGWFTPVSIGARLQEREYVACHGPLVNPISQLLKEADATFGPTRRVACILSIGSGEVGPISISTNSRAPIPY